MAAESSSSSAGVSTNEATFSTLTYNVLADGFAGGDTWDYVAEDNLKWSNRGAKIVKLLAERKADIVMLQEVQSSTRGVGRLNEPRDHAVWFEYELGKLRYRGVYSQRDDDALSSLRAPKNDVPPEEGKRNFTWPCDNGRIGQSIFYNTEKFERLASKDIQFSSHFTDKCEGEARIIFRLWYCAPAVLLRHKASGNLLLVASPHLPVPGEVAKKERVPALQVQYMAALIKELAAMVPYGRISLAGEGDSPIAAGPPDAPLVPVIIAGDFNAKPADPVCELLRRGGLPSDHAALKPISLQPKKDAKPGDPVPRVAAPYPDVTLGVAFGSAYVDCEGRDPPITNYAQKSRVEKKSQPAPASDASADGAAPAAAPATVTVETRKSEMFADCLDYIWYSRPVPHLQPAVASSGDASSNNSSSSGGGGGGGTSIDASDLRGSVLQALSVVPLPPVEELAAEMALPNSAHPSDHLPLQATFRFVPLGSQ